MKRLLVILLLCLVSGVYGQQVNAPEAKSFTLNTSGQDASGFSLSGFNSTSTLLCAIGLPTAPSGTTFYMTTTIGLTPASGYTMSGNKTRLAFTGTMANINAALATLKVNTTATSGTIQLSVSATVNPTGYFYNPSNGHFYRPISTGQTYPNAKTLSSQQTFKGQQGYLVTITSADEDAFIFNNVPQGNIWFALTDEVVEAQWKIDAGPEAGTLIKTSNGQTAGNIVGQYNNWAGGEPNNSGNEDYAVTKWGGGSQWNDLPAHFSCAYVVEFGTWANPDDATFTEFYSNSVNHSNGNVLRVQFQYDFGTTLNETQFQTKLFSNLNGAIGGTSNYASLNSLGKIDMTSGIDQNKTDDGEKSTISPGQAEYSYVNISNGVTTLYIDLRVFGSTQPSNVKAVSIFDAYSGPVTYQQSSTYWAHYIVPSTLTKITNGTSSFNSYIRNAGYDNWAFMSNISFGVNAIYRPHYSDMKYIGGTHSSLFSSIVTVGDVYLAFKQLSDNGIFGNSNVHFTSPIQFANADVDSSGVFNEQDCFILLKHLLGETTIWSNTSDLGNMVKFISNSEYNAITNNNWQNYRTTSTKYDLPSIVDGQLNSYNVAVTWKGDVNLSHSALPNGITQPSANSSINQIQTMSVKTMSTTSDIVAEIWMEQKDGNVETTIILNQNGNEVGATQFNVNFDNTILDYVKTEFTNKNDINFARKDVSSVNVGTLSTSGTPITNIGYKITFKPKSQLTNILGLISVQSVETIDTKSKQIKVIVQ
jgi:hypothetical protein